MFVCDLQGCEILRQTHGAGHGQESQSHHLVRHRNWEIAGLCKNTLWDFQARVWCQGKNDGLIEPHIIDWHLCVILKTLPVHPRSVPPVDLHVNIDVNKTTKNIDGRHVYPHIPLWFHNQNLSSNSRLFSHQSALCESLRKCVFWPNFLCSSAIKWQESIHPGIEL